MVECVGNDPVSEKMLVEIEWNAGEGAVRTELRMLSYSGKGLTDFHALNVEFYGDPYDTDDEDDANVFATLERVKAAHERSENYEKAARYKAAIDTLQTIKNK
jgi:hypothetical protein